MTHGDHPGCPPLPDLLWSQLEKEVTCLLPHPLPWATLKRKSASKNSFLCFSRALLKIQPNSCVLLNYSQTQAQQTGRKTLCRHKGGPILHIANKRVTTFIFQDYHHYTFDNLGFFNSIFFSSVQSLSCVRLSATPWIAARQASSSITNSIFLGTLYFCFFGGVGWGGKW